MIDPRPYQASSVSSALAHIKSSVSPCLIYAAPAAGKSFMIAMLADAIHEMSKGKKVLCLAPSAELVHQNAEKFGMTGERYSMFSASAGRKELRHKVVFGTPGTVKNRISRFKEGYAAVIIDEAQGTTPTIKAIIEAMREGNPNLRVIGLDGAPFRLGYGYIFREWPDGKINGEDVARDPYFAKCVAHVSAQDMLAQGYITPMDIGDVSANYDTSGLVEKRGKFTDESLHETFVGQGRLTAQIVANVVETARHRYGGCMLFAATVQHANEIMESLPPGNSGIVTGNDASAMGSISERKAVIAAYRAQRFKYLVSVDALTTGFDVAHTSTIATLRRTESAALLQQILGRAWRLDPEKSRSLWLDFAENAELHFPDGDIYSPQIKASPGKGEGGQIPCECPECGYENEFSLRKECIDMDRDEHGYCVDLDGNQIMTEHGPMPAHWGRRCLGQAKTGPLGAYERCGYFWTSKECPHCEHKNDIAARYCQGCKGEIIDPNEKLALEFKRIKRTPTERQTDRVTSFAVVPGVSRSGKPTVRADIVTPYRSFSVWFSPEATGWKRQEEYAAFKAVTTNGPPETVTYAKNAATGFYEVFAWNMQEDLEPV